MMTRNATISASTAVVARAEAFAATLSRSQRGQLYRTYTFDDATTWSNYPESVLGRRGRVGLRTGTLTALQWDALDALLASATGSGPGAGLDAVRAHLDADDLLLARGGRHGYGRGNFTVAFLGTPGDAGTWELQFGGHHLAVSNTYVDGVLVGATPSFRGIEPFPAFRHRGVDHRPEANKQQALAVLLASLDDEQRAAAELSRPHHDIVLGPGVDWAFPERGEGVPGAALRDDQRSLLLAAVATWVGDIDDEAATRFLARYRSELDTTRVAYRGALAVDRVGDYVRIDGPSVWIEFSLHDGIVCAGPHPHTVWRDRATDYGGTGAPAV